MQKIISTGYSIFFQDEGYRFFENYVLEKNYSTVFLLVDENTQKHCLPYFLENLKTDLNFHSIKITSGEAQKNLNTCKNIWDELALSGADRKSLLVNLGGGVITDMGGFAAASYKRGIDFINIPTTLLAMVDASVGSKTGIDLGGLKNQIGFFADPQMVLVDIKFLKTLPQEQIISGLAEIIKYGLSYDSKLWEDLNRQKLEPTESLIHRSISIKNEIVLQDKSESHLRKVLNFGHTIGHAVESYFLQSKQQTTITHGEAIAMGMVCACYLSQKYYPTFSLAQAEKIKNFIKNIFGNLAIAPKSYPKILDLLKHDKKNKNGQINFVLVERIGVYKIDCKVVAEDILEALEYYQK